MKILKGLAVLPVLFVASVLLTPLANAGILRSIGHAVKVSAKAVGHTSTKVAKASYKFVY